MKLKAVLFAVLLSMVSVSYSAELDALYMEVPSVLKSGSDNSKNFLGNELAYTNFYNKLGIVLSSSVEKSKNDYACSLSDDELNKNIEKQFKRVDFDKTLSDINKGIKAKNAFPSNKFAARRYIKHSRKVNQEILAKKKDIKTIKNYFNSFKNDYRTLTKEEKRKFYIHLCKAVDNIKAGEYSSAKMICEYIFKKILN